MTRFILAATLALTTATTAQAGNLNPLPVEPPVIAPIAPLPVAHDWRGGYLGAGLTFGRSTYSQPTLPDYWPNGRGVGLSGLAGYNWQSGSVVYGVEAHLGAARLEGETTIAGTDIQTDLNGLGSLRGRVGVASDRTLIFATLGVAAGRLTHTAVGLGSETQTVNGAVVGLGVEHALSGGLNIRGDLEHYRFQDRDFNTAGLAFPGVDSRANVARISAVFRF